jgi:hypothetical protein
MLTIMSSMVYPDTIYVQPRIQYASGASPSANFIVSCNLPTATWSGAIGTVTAKNRATPQLLTANLSSFTGVAVNQLLVNATHPSEAWTYQVASGSTWDISQPVTGCDTAASFPCPTPLTEVNTWTTGDTVSAYTPYTIYMSSLEPINQSDILPSSLVIGCALEGYNPSPFVSYVPFRSNATVTFSNDLEGALAEYSSGNSYQGSNSQVAPTFDNNSYLAFITGMFNPIFDAGILANQNFSIGQYFRNGLFEDDVILASLEATQIDGFYGANSTEFDNFLNGVYIATGITQLGGFIISHGPFWGPGYLHVNAGSTFGTRFGTFTQYFLQQGATQLNASTTACAQESTTTFTCGINLTPANLDGSLISGGFNGTAFALGAGQITSVQQTP